MTEKDDPKQSDSPGGLDAGPPPPPPIPPGTPVPPDAPEPDPDFEIGKMPDNPGLVTTFETLLKKPITLVDSMLRGSDSAQIVRNLVVTSIICLAVFGLVVGTYSMGTQLWAAPLKITLGMLVAGLICLPSLYIFSCLSGFDIKISSAAGMMFATICMMAMLLLGFTPVVWIFSQSTDSIVFMGALALVFWAIATYFGFGLISKTAKYLGLRKRTHLVVWMGIFVLVILQMTTSLRPIVGESDQFLTGEKKFFLDYWSEQIRADQKSYSPDETETAGVRKNAPSE